MAIFCTMLSIVLMSGSNELTASKVFVIAAYFDIVASTMSQMFVRGVAEIAGALIAFRRLQNFLEYEEKDACRLEYLKMAEIGLELKDDKQSNNRNGMEGNAVLIKNATARWIPLSKINAKKDGEKKGNKSVSNGTIGKKEENETWQNPTLDSVNIDFKKVMLICIVGPVGAGKSTLLQAILNELPLESDAISVNGTISYAAQEPWIFAGSARQNILFGQEMNRHRYDDIVKVCALSKDFEQFEYGDRTVIGEKGASLSGGQQARFKVGLELKTYSRLALDFCAIIGKVECDRSYSLIEERQFCDTRRTDESLFKRLKQYSEQENVPH